MQIETSTESIARLKVSASPELQHEIEQFLYMEASLLDAREYAEWFTLMADDLHYWAPTRRNRMRREAQLENSKPDEVSIFNDTKQTLGWRVRQMLTGTHWAEDPPSRTRHCVSNVRIAETDVAHEYVVTSNFICYRNRLETETDLWAGERVDTLRRVSVDVWQIARRTIYLDMNVLLSKNMSVFL